MRFFFCIVLLLSALFVNNISAQNTNRSNVYNRYDSDTLPSLDSIPGLDSLVLADLDAMFAPLPKYDILDSTLLDVSVFSFLTKDNFNGEGSAWVNQPAYMTYAFEYYKNANLDRKKSGYRIRIFYDNKQSARESSANIERRFLARFPDILAYRSYSTPYFKVVVGDYRTKSDAIRDFAAIKRAFPSALIVKEYIKFPKVENESQITSLGTL